MERTTRIAAAAFVVIGGLVHLQLWRTGYSAIPRIGALFIANVVASAVLALVVLVRNNRAVTFAGIIFALGSLVALVMSRTIGILGFTERDWTDQALRATTAELGAIVAFAALLVASGRFNSTMVPAVETVTRRARRTPGR